MDFADGGRDAARDDPVDDGEITDDGNDPDDPDDGGDVEGEVAN